MVIGSMVLNEIVVGLAVSYLSVLMCGIGVLMAWRGFSPLRQLPTFHWVCAELALHITLTDMEKRRRNSRLLKSMKTRHLKILIWSSSHKIRFVALLC
ncbi:uncharacterized protein LOC111046540 isoform X2 [Nilaparvata lugens]|uniref:uncharacterized protein LOC111046540 isoform X2 n=1 Tax=Nilaparvata lugens TaxID=108931 RepID=UPI00193D91F4|nr:uncharacterized protein LOC111046540 isoform X2 [Nilaparvata lugens]